MIVEDEQDLDMEPIVYHNNNTLGANQPNQPTNFSLFLSQMSKIWSSSYHYILKDDLIEHLWAHKGSNAFEELTCNMSLSYLNW